jgi:hypothetical protein
VFGYALDMVMSLRPVKPSVMADFQREAARQGRTMPELV